MDVSCSSSKPTTTINNSTWDSRLLMVRTKTGAALDPIRLYSLEFNGNIAFSGGKFSCSCPSVNCSYSFHFALLYGVFRWDHIATPAGRAARIAGRPAKSVTCCWKQFSVEKQSGNFVSVFRYQFLPGTVPIEPRRALSIRWRLAIVPSLLHLFVCVQTSHMTEIFI